MVDDQGSWAERRCAMRVPVRGIVVLHADHGSLHGTVENLSQTGALINVASEPGVLDHELELRLADGAGWLTARTVRVEQIAPRATWRIAVAFDRVEPEMTAAIEAAIVSAVSAARRRPILVIDDHAGRRTQLIDRLVDRGMTPLAPRTPLETIDLLTREQPQIGLCLLAPGFGVVSSELAGVLADSFPWVTTSEITDDLDHTVDRAVEVWSTTAGARLGTAIV